MEKKEKELRIRLNQAQETLFFQCVNDIVEKTSFTDMEQFIQHGKTSCLLHSYAVAYYSLYAVSKLGIRCNKRSLVRGALLHDYFLYDWHDGDPSHRLHGFYHPGRALMNAKREISLTSMEEDLIKHHMFPLTIYPPMCREAVVVCIVDKICSLYELPRRVRYERLYSLWKRQCV